jgi:hypothetical protein
VHVRVHVHLNVHRADRTNQIVSYFLIDFVQADDPDSHADHVSSKLQTVMPMGTQL